LGKKTKGQGASQKKQSSPEVPPVKEKPGGQKDKKKQPVLQKRENPNRLLTGLAGAGMVLTAYLALTAWLGHPPLYCNEGSSCDVVQRSRWGTFLALPTAFWGFLTYTALAFIGLRVRKPMPHWKSAWTVSMAGLGYSIYLIAVSLFVIKAACAYCIASFSIMTVIFAALTIQRPKELPGFKFSSFAGQTVIITALLVGGMHLHYSGVFTPSAGPEDPFLKGLAEHLTQDKAVLYGAYW
jgi:uncharacterized membrane protein